VPRLVFAQYESEFESRKNRLQKQVVEKSRIGTTSRNFMANFESFQHLAKPNCRTSVKGHEGLFDILYWSLWKERSVPFGPFGQKRRSKMSKVELSG
jgi:hypothetical protein